MDNRKLPVWISVNSPSEWREWLSKNHAKCTGIWLKISKVHAPHPMVFLSDAVMEAICFGWIDGQMFSLDETSIITHFGPRQSRSVWSLINRNRAERLLKEGRMTEAGLKTIDEAKANGRWDIAYSSKEKTPLPEDLAKALKENPKAFSNFEAYSNSEQSQAIYWVCQTKVASTRRKRIAVTVERALNQPKK